MTNQEFTDGKIFTYMGSSELYVRSRSYDRNPLSFDLLFKNGVGPWMTKAHIMNETEDSFTVADALFGYKVMWFKDCQVKEVNP
jgi:hypothetical protein